MIEPYLFQDGSDSTYFPYFDQTYLLGIKIHSAENYHFQYETRKEGEVVLEGSNASAEEADEGTEESAVSGVDVVLNHQLVETGFGSKKDFTTYLKDYMKKVVKYLEENKRDGEVEDFKKNISAVMKDLLGSFKDLQFFTGESVGLI